MEPRSSDHELLQAFAQRRDEGAFAQIVQRYANLVYAAAARQVGPGLAEDVTQVVFSVLARKAAKVGADTLAGWLIKTARLSAMAACRQESRRKRHEQKAASMRSETPSQADREEQWPAISLLLDGALSKLGEKDRTAVTLRYLHGKSAREMAEMMNTTEYAASKRAGRALQKMRNMFERRGVTLTAETLGGVLSVHGIVAAPAELTAKLCACHAATSLASGSMVTEIALQVVRAARVKVAMMASGAVVLATASVVIAAQLFSTPAKATVIRYVVEPSTQPAQPPTPKNAEQETFHRFATATDGVATFSGKVEGLNDVGKAEVGIIYFRGGGPHWTHPENYQWQAVKADGTFSIAANRYPEASRAIAVRSKRQSVTFVEATFDPGESADGMIVRMKPAKAVTIYVSDKSGKPVENFTVGVFTAGQIVDEKGNSLPTQVYESLTGSNGWVHAALPAEEVGLWIVGGDVASRHQIIDPSKADRFELSLMRKGRIQGHLTRSGKPLVGKWVLMENPAERFSAINVHTDEQGKFRLNGGIPGNYVLRYGNVVREVVVAEGQTTEVDIEMKPPRAGAKK